MNMNRYQQLSQRTINRGLSDREVTMNMAMGLAGEAGETVDYLKKHLFHGHALDTEHLVKELGDVLFYIAALATIHGVLLDDIAYSNVEKLKARYPQGFNIEDSLNREEYYAGLVEGRHGV